jgi:hypothetical protein
MIIMKIEAGSRGGGERGPGLKKKNYICPRKYLRKPTFTITYITGEITK